MNINKKSYSKIASLLVIFVLLFTMIPSAAFADNVVIPGEAPFTIPEGATQVYVTHPNSESPFADANYGSAYGYIASTDNWTGSGTSFEFEAGSGNAGSDGSVSRGAEFGPSYFKLTVVESEKTELATGDVNGDGNIDTVDASMIISYYYGKINSFE